MASCFVCYPAVVNSETAGVCMRHARAPLNRAFCAHSSPVEETSPTQNHVIPKENGACCWGSHCGMTQSGLVRTRDHIGTPSLSAWLF